MSGVREQIDMLQVQTTQLAKDLMGIVAEHDQERKQRLTT